MWGVIGWAGRQESVVGGDGTRWYGVVRDRGLSQPRSLLSSSPGCDSHHGTARVTGGGGGDTGVPDLLRIWPTRAHIPVVLWEAGGEVPPCHTEQGPRTLFMVRDPHG